MQRISYMLAIAACFLGMGVHSQPALDFNGETDHVILGGEDLSPPWTMEVKISKNETDDYQHLLTGNDGNSGIRIEQYLGTKVGITLAGVADHTFKYSLPLNHWVHLALVADPDTVRLFVDGKQAGAVKATLPLPMKWISKPDAEASLKARIRDLRIWRTALRPEIIRQWKDSTAMPGHPAYSMLEHYYPMKEGAGNVIHDEKGNLDGRIVGARWCIPVAHDIGIVRRTLPETTPDNYSPVEPVGIRIRNYGSEPVAVDFPVLCILNGQTSTVVVGTSMQPLEPNAVRDVAFPPMNMDRSGSYRLSFKVAFPGDQNPSNDTLTSSLESDSHPLGKVTAMQQDTTCFTFTCGEDKVRLILYDPGLFRIWLGPDGVFTDPAGGEIVLPHPWKAFPVALAEENSCFRISTQRMTIRVYKNPLRFGMYDAENKHRIWEERVPLDYGTRTIQSLESAGNEYFYGCGMQNGYFSHRGKKVTIGLKITNWDDGAVPNPAPFYMSTAGYGVFRNTFSGGEYDFKAPGTFAHKEKRFDAWYFAGPGLKEILGEYTLLTGRPFLPPRWGLTLGDANCYNKGSETTPVVIDRVARPYREHNMPGGWILPNDGYGCGYTRLDSVSAALRDLGFRTGLWTESGLAKLPWEVDTAGIRAYKLDVAWVGEGYRLALSACRQAFTGIESNRNARGFVWSVCGWAGTQRYSTVWSGDQSGSWEYIRFHIPTLLGAGLTGFSNASSDLDGIFGGSPETYTRDLQWKTFIPEYYAMSGWAKKNRQPWVHGEPFTSINRDWLLTKMRLLPYLYSYCREASETGVPVVRPLLLEFPGDTVALGTRTQYEFLSGEWILVAPVFRNDTLRDSIYLPEGKWYAWHDSRVVQGPVTLNRYPAPLRTIPVFVRAGAIIPLYPAMLYDGQWPADTVTFDIYPEGHSRFEWYEDDGSSQEYRKGAFSITLLECRAPANGEKGEVTFTIHPSTGEYRGKPAQRTCQAMFHYRYSPVEVLLDGKKLKRIGSKEPWRNAGEGFFYDPADQGGMVMVRTPGLPTGIQHTLKIK